MGTEKNIKISINLPEGLYREIESSALDNERTIAGEVVYRVRRYNQGVEPINLVGGVIPGLGTMPEPKKEDIKVNEEWLYEDLIAKIGESMDRDVSYDERQELHTQVKEAGLVWNTFLKRLEKFEEGKVKIIHQY